MTTVLCVPQWQGSASGKAPQLTAGARRAAGLVPAAAVVTVPVLESGGEKVAGVRALLQATGWLAGRPVYVHIDLDVLEPTVFGSTCYPEPNGVRPQRLMDLISQIDDIVGGAITEHAPGGDDVEAGEAEVIRQLGAALAR
jgi:arginase